MGKTWQKWLPKLVGQALNTAGLFAPPQNGGMVYEGLCQTQKGQGAEPPEKILQKAIPSSINVNGQDFHIHIFSQGSEAILLAHGWESNSGDGANS